MSYCCSQCDFTAGFQSVLMMHRQLHHNRAEGDSHPEPKNATIIKDKALSLPRSATLNSFRENKGSKLLCRTASATKLFGKLRARLSRTKMSHCEELAENLANNFSVPSDCTSKAHDSPQFSRCSADVLSPVIENNETYACHLCTFDADRITVLDRHLLNDHKIGLENLLKLVMAKTKDGLSTDPPIEIYGIRQPYYRLPDEIIEEGEFVIETVAPKIKVLKHCGTNTNLVSDLKTDFDTLSKELEELSKTSIEKCSKDELISKMQIISEYMCKFADSSKMLKNVLAKEFGSKQSVRSSRARDDSVFEGYEKSDGTMREWERAHSDKSERTRSRHSEICRPEKPKFLSESFYF